MIFYNIHLTKICDKCYRSIFRVEIHEGDLSINEKVLEGWGMTETEG